MLERARVKLAKRLLAGMELEVCGDAVRLRRRAMLAGAFMERSGFLRDGRYPGGRHAERKLRKWFRVDSDFNPYLGVWK